VRPEFPWQQLHACLSSGHLREEQVSELVDVAAGYSREGWPVKVFPKGTPVPDGLVLHTVFDRDGIEQIVRLLLEQARLDIVKVFPLGTPVPDRFVAEIELR
jgi:hypothetical protein